MPRSSLLVLLASTALIGGCMPKDKLVLTSGVTGKAGNAIAANTVLQMVDPWQLGVDDTDLETPAERGDGGEDAPVVAPDPQSP